MQVRPPAATTLSSSIEYHAPLPPSIPLSSINTLIPRLTTTINDIDHLRNLIGAGYVDGSLPSWDTLLQRYSLLLGRINALSNYISPPSTLTTTTTTTTSSSSSSATTTTNLAPPPPPPLSGYLVHPLNPLPSTTNTNTANGENEVNPLAFETFFQVINTQLIPSLTNSQESTLSNDQTQTQTQTQTQNQHQGSSSAKTTTTRWHTADELRGMDDRALDILKRSLKDRLNKESIKIDVMKREIDRREEEIDWTMRIDEAEEEDDNDDQDPGEGENQVQGDTGGVSQIQDKNNDHDDDDESDDDLFGGDDDDGDEPMIIDVDAEKTERIGTPKQVDEEEKSEEINWKLEDYVNYMDSGKIPSNI
ncbi:uncharacterized protein IL334_007759 [Kwoniella shivajii]|uniref:Mediator complex subunit 8 n=1 Tax=Kwoniella shivajii TaxID=564305 RepID=A0ABZ1DBN4_9TREE|nr:hypothetical protein IL334_007759 [Kwoniella shivajii]